MVEIRDDQLLMLVSGGINYDRVYKVFVAVTNVAFCFVVGDILSRWVNRHGLVHPISEMVITVLQFAILPLVDGWFDEHTGNLAAGGKKKVQ